ncbi:8-oxoguanine DNA glycosylase OGG fold protein [Mycobacterium antarcticum]|uniref:8-oxoguanine DNA glycosylase OGG fold protein n=1 Tax=Mycolicibacterium sp. TUM20984 TaxID=3023368 RepID=UPI0032EA2687
MLAQPPVAQRSFPWNRSAWAPAMHDLPDVLRVLESLPDKVDRNLIPEVVTTQLEDERVLPAFVSAMVWGYGDSGYGPTRVRWILSGVKTGAHDASVRGDVAVLLRTAANTVRVQGPVEGFRYMNNAGRIKYLGGAFFTKWLSFASALINADDPCAAPILDKQVHDWLQREAGISLNIHRTPDYERYLDTLKAWGADYDRTAVQVEKSIFGLATGRT